MAIKLFPYGVIEPIKIPDTADRVLNDYFKLIKLLKIPSCLAYGLCLGFVRGGGYIVGDNDLDVIAITPTNSLTPDLSEALIKRGFTRGHIFPPPTNNAHFHRDRILLDIFFREQSRFYSEFDAVMYKGEAYPVPHPIDGYLSECYSNWRVRADEAGKRGL